jgi:hypothetical protein
MSAMRLLPRSLPGWTIAGAAVGFLCVLAVAMLVVYDEVYVDCGRFEVAGQTLGGRCHYLGYAVGMVLGPLFSFGAIAAAVGGLAGLAIGIAVLRFRRAD